MQFPIRSDLPFFAYGVFRPGQLAFFRLKRFLDSPPRPHEVPGRLWIRDGLPLLELDGGRVVEGSLLHFRPTSLREAYQAIVELEPDSQYRWDDEYARKKKVNVLVGKFPKKGPGEGSVLFEGGSWDGRKDPLFTSALDVIGESLEENQAPTEDLKSMFRLQMAYLLLWSAMERYLSLRYHLGNEVNQKLKSLASEPAFVEALRETGAVSREIHRTDKPKDRYKLDPSNATKSLEYYYQVRSNITHRGKGVSGDHERVRMSLAELLPIFRKVLQRAFTDASI